MVGIHKFNKLMLIWMATWRKQSLDQICVLCVCLSASCDILRTGCCIVVQLLPAWSASCGKLHKLLDEFPTRMQNGQHAICLSLRFQCAMLETMSFMLAIPTACSSNLFETTPFICSHKTPSPTLRLYLHSLFNELGLVSRFCCLLETSYFIVPKNTLCLPLKPNWAIGERVTSKFQW